MDSSCTLWGVSLVHRKQIPRPSAARPRRAGMGMLLIVILILVTVMTFVALARAFFSRGVTSQVLRSSLGVQAQSIAESAVEEGLSELRRRVNDASDPIFVPFREEVYSGEETEIPISLQTPLLEGLLARYPDLAQFDLESCGAVVNFQRQFSAVPYERFGLAKVSATVSRSLGLTTRVTRRVELGVEFKVQLLSTPRPFDQTAVYVQDGDSLLRAPFQTLDDVIQSIEYRRSEHEDMVDRMESQKGTVPFNGEAMLARHQGVSIPEPDYWRSKVPMLEEPAALFALGRAPDGIHLEHLGIAEAIRSAHRRVQDAEEAYQDARSQLESDFHRQDRHNDYLNKLKILLGAYSEMVGKMENFRGLFQIWDGDKHAALAGFDYKLTPDEWRRKATFVLDRHPGRLSPQTVLDTLLRERGRLDGVFYSNWPGKSLRLRGRNLPGRAVLVAEQTEVSLHNVNTGTGPDDLLTVVSFGNLRLSGKIRASILALGSVQIEPGTEIVGNLVFREVPDTRDLKGRVEHDPRYFSGRTTSQSTRGAKTQYYWVTVAPRPIYKAVYRQ